jgi:hypothetical protein
MKTKWKRHGVWRAAVIGLWLVLIGCVHCAWADVAGPVVGFVRVEVTSQTQWVQPPVQPSAAQTDAGETAGQVLSDYLGEQFRSGADADAADWIGFESQDAPGRTSMVWRDTQGQWRDSDGETVEPSFTEEFWLELVFDPGELESGDGRELVLCGEAHW